MADLLIQEHYDREAIKSALDASAQLECLAAPEDGQRRLLLKPNFVMPSAREDASTTHPEFYLAVAELLLDRGFSIGIGESPAIGSCRAALKAHDAMDDCDRLGIDIVEFKKPRQVPGVSDLRNYRTLTIAREIEQWDRVVNLPKLKTHQQFTFTAATKNLYGCVTGKRKFVRHNLCRNDPVRFARMILANAKAVNPVLHIADGITAMHIKGPRGGAAFDLGRVLISEDHLELDWLFCLLTGLRPEQTPLFMALGAEERDSLGRKTHALQHVSAFTVAQGFVHAPLIHISFSPWAIARSAGRSIRHAMGRNGVHS